MRRSTLLLPLALALVPACRCDRGAPSAQSSASSSASAPNPALAASASASASTAASVLVDDLTKALADVEDASAAAPEPSAKVERLEATIAAPKVAGASEALAKGKWRLRACVTAAAADAGSAAGRFAFELLFDADGRVASAKPKEAKGALADCLAAALAKIPFPAPSEEGARGEVVVDVRGNALK